MTPLSFVPNKTFLKYMERWDSFYLIYYKTSELYEEEARE